jgi:hypothetical protein
MKVPVGVFQCRSAQAQRQIRISFSATADEDKSVIEALAFGPKKL